MQLKPVFVVDTSHPNNGVTVQVLACAAHLPPPENLSVAPRERLLRGGRLPVDGPRRRDPRAVDGFGVPRTQSPRCHRRRAVAVSVATMNPPQPSHTSFRQRVSATRFGMLEQKNYR